MFAHRVSQTISLCCSPAYHNTIFYAAQVDSALAVVRGVLAGKSLGDALVATRQHSASEYQYQFVKARNDYLQQARPAPWEPVGAGVLGLCAAGTCVGSSSCEDKLCRQRASRGV